MGSCQTSEVIESESNKVHKSKKKPNISEEQINTIEEQRNEFPDMPEWDGDRYTGIGIKKMKGYKCNLPIDKLNKRREDFWDQRNSRNNENYKMWRIINQACVYDELRANMLLEEYGLTTESGCINHLIDSEGYHYHIPNYCINDPYFERQYKKKKNVEEKKVKIKLFEPMSNINEEITVNNTMTGKELKELFRKDYKIGDNFNLRLFFAGMEITDDHSLYQHNLKNGFKIQVMKLPKIDAAPTANNNDKKSNKKKGKKKTKKKKKTKEDDENKNSENNNNSEVNSSGED